VTVPCRVVAQTEQLAVLRLGQLGIMQPMARAEVQTSRNLDYRHVRQVTEK